LANEAFLRNSGDRAAWSFAARLFVLPWGRAPPTVARFEYRIDADWRWQIEFGLE
jgi:hypothetical protein